MSDLSAYRDKVANLGKQAYDAEQSERYELAVDLYTKAIEIFMYMIKCKSRNQLTRKMKKTLDLLKSSSKR